MSGGIRHGEYRPPARWATRRGPAMTTTHAIRLPQAAANDASRVGPPDACFRDYTGAGVATPRLLVTCPSAARDACAASLGPSHPANVDKHWIARAATGALPLEAALLPDTDVERHRLSHGPGDLAVSRPTTRRVLVVRWGSEVFSRRAVATWRSGHHAPWTWRATSADPKLGALGRSAARSSISRGATGPVRACSASRPLLMTGAP